MIARLQPDPQIPETLQEVYAHLAGIVIETFGLFDELTTLYGDQDTVELLNDTAPTFFLRHQRLLYEGLIMSISRLTDEKQTGRRSPQFNLTLSQLLDPESTPTELRFRLHEQLKAIQAMTEPMRKFRHKIVAHAAIAEYLAPSTNLGDNITITLLRISLEQIAAYLAAFDCHFTGVDGPVRYVRGHGEATDLLAYLRLGREMEQRQNAERYEAAAQSSITSRTSVC